MNKQRRLIHTYTWKTVWQIIRIDTFITIASYFIVAVYCIVCSRAISSMNGTERCSAIIQLFVDSIVPTTITLMLTNIIQSYYGRKRYDRKAWFLFSLLGVVAFAILTAGFHPIVDRRGLIAVIVSSIILALLGFCMVFEERTASHTWLGVSGRED